MHPDYLGNFKTDRGWTNTSIKTDYSESELKAMHPMRRLEIEREKSHRAKVGKPKKGKGKKP